MTVAFGHQRVTCVRVRAGADREVISGLLRWMGEEQVFAMSVGGTVGGGGYLGFFEEGDAERVIAYLRERIPAEHIEPGWVERIRGRWLARR